MAFQWKRGSKRIEAKTRVRLDAEGTAKVTDHITLLATLYFDSKRQRFQDKNATLNVLALPSNPKKPPKLLGAAKINMAAYAKPPVLAEDESPAFPLTRLELSLRPAARGALSVGVMSKILSFDNNASPARGPHAHAHGEHLSTVRSIDSMSEDPESSDEAGPGQSGGGLSALVEKIKSEKQARGPPRALSPLAPGPLSPLRSPSPQIAGPRQPERGAQLERYLKSSSSQSVGSEAGEEALRARNEQLGREKQELGQRNERLCLEKDQLAMKVSALSRELARAKLGAGDLKKELGETAFFLEEARREKEELMQAAGEKDAQLRARAAEAKELALQVRSEDGAAQVIAALRRKAAALEEELARELRQRHARERQADALEAELARCKAQARELGDHVTRLSGALKKYELAYSALAARKKGGGPSPRALGLLERIVGHFADLRARQTHLRALLADQREEALFLAERVRQQIERLQPAAGVGVAVQVDLPLPRANTEARPDPQLEGQVRDLVGAVARLEKDRAHLEMEVVEYKLKFAEALNANTELEKRLLHQTSN